MSTGCVYAGRAREFYKNSTKEVILRFQVMFAMQSRKYRTNFRFNVRIALQVTTGMLIARLLRRLFERNP